MFVYSIESDTLVQDNIVWSSNAIAAVAPGILTPFSYSVLAEIMRRGWYSYYDRLGFEPPAGRRLLRHHNGRVYLNLSISAQLEAERAGIAPLSFWQHGKASSPAGQPIVAWQKPSLLASIKTGRNQKRIATTLAELSSELNKVELRTHAWYKKTTELKWTQAEILQVMEEIERVGADSAMIFLAACHNLMLLYNRLFQICQEQGASATDWAQAKTLLSQTTSLQELEIAKQIEHMGALLQQARAETPALDEWFASGQLATWRQTLPDGPLKVAISAFFDQYGHRGALEGELAYARWNEAAAPVLEAIWACATQAAAVAEPASIEALMASLQTQLKTNQKQLMQWSQEAKALYELQSRALSAFSYIQAGTRTWALAAANEAMSDGRLTSSDQVFYFELEEIKQMMTGEWNVSSLEEIQATATERKAQFQSWQQATATALLIGDAEATPIFETVGAPESAHLIELDQTRTSSAYNTSSAPLILHVEQLSAGDAIFLPCAHGFVVNADPVLAPIGAAIQKYQRPIYLALS